MKKQLKRAIFCAICMIVVGVMCLTGVTYAWFTKSDSAIVDGIDIQTYTAEGGILISTDPNGGVEGKEWAYKLVLPGLDNIKNFRPASTHPDTIVGNNGKLRFFDAEVDPAQPFGGPIRTKEVGADAYNKNEGHYVVSDIYLNNVSGTSDVTVSLQGTKVSLTTDSEPMINLSTRIAIVDHGDYMLGENQTASKNNAAGVVASTANQVKIYENDANKHLTGSTDYQDTYGVIKAKGDLDASGQPLYFPANDESTGAVKLVEAETDASKVTITIKQGMCHKITIYTWIEGQDVDCINDASGGNYSVEIHFTLPTGA